MSHEDAFLIALAITLGGTLAVTVYMRRPLRRLLVQACETSERASFWMACIEIILLLSPLLALLLVREHGTTRGATTILAAADLLWAPLLGLMIAVFLMVLIVAVVVNQEPSWDAKLVPKDQREDVKRLLSKIDSIRAREILVREAEEAPPT